MKFYFLPPKYSTLLFLYILSTLLCNAQTQVPISSIYQNLKNDASPTIKKLYQLLNDYYYSKISISQLEKTTTQIPEDIKDRENAIKNMTLSYVKLNDDDFGFYNLRLAVNYAEKLPNNDIIKGIVFAEFGNYLITRETLDLGIEYLRKSIPILEKYKPQDLEGLGFSLENKILRSFQKLDEIDSVKFYIDKVITTAKKYQNKIWLSSAYNNKGYQFYLEKKYDEALASYALAKEALSLTTEEHIIFYENINENIAHVYAEKGKHKEAIEIQNKVIDVRLKYPKLAGISTIKGLIYFADYCRQNNEAQIAFQKFKTVEKIFQLYNIQIENSIDFLQLKMKLSQMSGDIATYQYYYNLLLNKKKDELDNEKLMLVKRKGINKFIKSRNDLFEQQLEIEKLNKSKLQQSLSYRNIIIIGLFVLFSVIGFLIHKYGIYKKKLVIAEKEQLLQRKQILDLENLNLKNNIELKEKDISKVVADNKLRTELKKDFLKKLDQLANLDNQKLKSSLRRLKLELDVTVEQHDKIDLLQNNIDEINTLFETKLREAIPTITQSEIDICSLIRLGYNNTDIANIVNKTPENVRINKFRIKQKASIENMKDFEALIKSF
jgi:hypothetical protein